MKRISFLIAVLILCLLNVQAQRIIALQNGSKVFFHQNIDTIMVHSESGDTIYLPGYTYNKNLTISKKLTIYGTGHYPDSTAATNPTRIYGTLILTTAASGSTFEGISLEGDISMPAGNTFNNFIFSRMKFNNLNMGYINQPSTLLMFNECVIVGYIFGSINVTNVVFEKCIIQGVIQSFENVTLINHCILLTNGIVNYSGWSASNFYHCNGIEANSNVIVGNYVNYPNTCTFKNNLIVAAPGLIFPNQGNIESQAFAGIFENIITGKEYTFDYENDYHLKLTSAGIGAGFDNTDTGIYGTEYPFKINPSNPHVSVLNNATEVKNGKLKVDVTVEAQSR